MINLCLYLHRIWGLNLIPEDQESQNWASQALLGTLFLWVLGESDPRGSDGDYLYIYTQQIEFSLIKIELSPWLSDQFFSSQKLIFDLQYGSISQQDQQIMWFSRDYAKFLYY